MACSALADANETLLQSEFEQAELEFLEDNSMEEVDDGANFSDSEFERSLEYAAEVTIQTTCNIDDDVAEFLARGCGCKKYNNASCSELFSGEEVTSYRFAIAELDKSELDIAILSQLHAGMNCEELLSNTRGISRHEVRQRVTFRYILKGRAICREMFIYLHRISRTRLYNFSEHLTANGFMTRVHGNKGKMPKHAYTFNEISQVVDFIKHYADVHAVPLPGRLPGRLPYRIMKLPSDVTKASVYAAYTTGLQALDEHVRIISYR